MDLDPHLANVAMTVRFKEYLLNRDIASRNTILLACIDYMETALDNNIKTQGIEWLRNLALITATVDTDERKQRIRFDACWDELHHGLSKSTSFMRMVRSLNI